MEQPKTSIQERFSQALDELINQIQKDRTVLAAILCGSLSHDKVWEKSDIDLTLITTDDRSTEGHLSLNAHGVNVHACLISRTGFRKMIEGTTRNSFIHSYHAKGRLLYTHDPSIAALCERLHEIGERDTKIQLLQAGSLCILPLYKAHKWLLTRGDLEYAALWILHSASHLARIEVLTARLLADREVIPQALQLNPAFFHQIYTRMLNEKKSSALIESALAAIDAYLAERSALLFQPILDYLRDVGEIRSCTEIEAHFHKNHGVEGVSLACEYLADQGLLTKASTPARLTTKSNVSVEELAFAFTEPTRDEF